eukprot:gene13056-8902_t
MAYIISHIRNSLQTRKFKTITTTKVHNIKYKVNSTSWPAKAQKYLRIKQPTVITKLQGDLHVNHKSNLAAHKLKETNSSLQTTNPSLIIYSLKTLNTVQRKAQQRYNHINHPTVCVSQQLQTTLAHSTDSCDRHSTVNLYNITTNQPLSNAIVTPYTNSVVHNNKRIKPKQPTNQLQIQTGSAQSHPQRPHVAALSTGPLQACTQTPLIMPTIKHHAKINLLMPPKLNLRSYHQPYTGYSYTTHATSPLTDCLQIKPTLYKSQQLNSKTTQMNHQIIWAVSSHQITHYNNNELKNLAHSQAQLYKRIRSLKHRKQTKIQHSRKSTLLKVNKTYPSKPTTTNPKLTHMSQVYNLYRITKPTAYANYKYPRTSNTHNSNHTNFTPNPRNRKKQAHIERIINQTPNNVVTNHPRTTCNHIQFMWEAYKTLKCRSLKQQPLQPKFPTHPQTVILKQFKVTLPTHSHQLALYRRKHQLYTSNNRKHPTSKASN